MLLGRTSPRVFDYMAEMSGKVLYEQFEGYLKAKVLGSDLFSVEEKVQKRRTELWEETKEFEEGWHAKWERKSG